MRRFLGGALLVVALAIAAVALSGGPQQAEAQAPKYMWEDFFFMCLDYPVDCDIVWVPG